MTNRSFIVGIDGGGSKTAVFVADATGEILGRGTGGASNYQAVGLAAAQSALNTAVGAALADAALTAGPVTADDVAAVCLGQAGVDRPEDHAIFNAWLTSVFPRAASRIVNDGYLVLAAGTPAEVGIALISGTGVVCIARNAAGKTARFDGWGHIMGDLGSGYYMGRRALQAAMCAYDGRGPQTPLLATILAHWELTQPAQLIARVYQAPATTTEIAALSRFVDAAAAEGDETACQIVEDAGAELARTVATAARVLEFDGEIPCALAGGTITKGLQVQAAFFRAVSAAGVRLHPVELVTEPVRGAVRMAQRLLQA